MKEKFKYLIPLIIITTLAFPRPAFAIIGTGIFDYFETALGGIEEFSGPVAKFIFNIFLFYVFGLGAVFISSHLLQTVLGDLGLVSIINNTMVRTGWSFVAGLTNMFFILLFVFIALATILKIETFAAKKLLPKLLIVALLVNFSLVFVGIMIDVSNIFYKTIIGGDTSLVPDILSILTGSGEDILVTIIVMVASLIVLFIIPFSSPFAQMGLVVLIVATGFIGYLLVWAVQGMMFFMMSGILLTYVFLFSARTFVLQLLAMVSPIAFLCSVLPSTKKYWDDWLKMVVEWNTFGIVTLLFLVVGLRGANAIFPLEASSPISFSGATLFWAPLPAYFSYYFFLFVYLTALLYFSQKYSPQMASMLIGQAKAMGGMIYAKGLKPLGSITKRNATKIAATQEQREADAEEKKARGESLTRREKLQLGAGRIISRPVKGWYRLQGKTVQQKGAEMFKEAEDKVSKVGQDLGSLKTLYAGDKTWQHLSPEQKSSVALHAAKIKGEAGLDKVLSKDQQKEALDAIAMYQPHRVGDIVKYKPDFINDARIGNRLQGVMVKTDKEGNFEKDEGGNFKDDDVRFLVEKDVTIDGKKASKLMESAEGKKAIAAEAVQKKAIGSLERADFKNLSYEKVNDEKFLERAVKYRTDWEFFRRLATERGVDLTKAQDVVDKDEATFEEFCRINPNFVRSALHAGKGMMRPWKYKNNGKNYIEEKEDLNKIMNQIKPEKTFTPERLPELWGISDDKVKGKPDKEIKEMINSRKTLIEKPSTIKGAILGKVSKKSRKEMKELKEEEEKLIESIDKDIERFEKQKEDIKETREKIDSLNKEADKPHSTKVLKEIKKDISKQEGKLGEKIKNHEKGWDDMIVKRRTLNMRQGRIKKFQEREIRERKRAAGFEVEGPPSDVELREKARKMKGRDELMKEIVIPEREINERYQRNFLQAMKEGRTDTIRKTILEPDQKMEDWFRKEAEKELKREKADEILTRPKEEVAKEIERLKEGLKEEPVSKKKEIKKNRKRDAARSVQTDIKEESRKRKREREEKKFFREDKLYTRGPSGEEIEIKSDDYSLKAIEEVKRARKRKEEEKGIKETKK